MCLAQTMLSRVKSQLDGETEQRKKAQLDEMRVEASVRRLQRQVHDLEDELIQLKGKAADSEQRRDDLVSWFTWYSSFDSTSFFHSYSF